MLGTKRWAALFAIAVAAIHCGTNDDEARNEARDKGRVERESVGVVRQRSVVLPPNAPPSLKTVAVPRPSNLGDFVADEAAAVRLGKALFWEMQVGSDRNTAIPAVGHNGGAALTSFLGQ